MTPKPFTPENEHFLTVQKYLIEAYRMVDISRFKVDFLNGASNQLSSFIKAEGLILKCLVKQRVKYFESLKPTS